MARCKCKHGRKRRLLQEHPGYKEPHKVRRTKKEERLGRGMPDGFYYWNTGRIQ